MSRLFFSILCAALFASCEAGIFPPSGPYRIDRNLARHLQQSVNFADLGGEVASSPSCLSRDGHGTHCFFVTPNKTVGYANVVDGHASIENFGGSVAGQPQTVGYDRDGVFALFLTPENELVVVAVNTKTEFDKKATTLDFGTFLEAPGCVTMVEDDTIFCIKRGTNGGMYTFRFEDGKWGSHAHVADNPSGPVSCVLNKVAHRIHCWAVDDGRLSEKLFMDTGLPDTRFWFHVGQRGRGRVNVYMVGVIPLPRGLSSSRQDMVDIFGTYGGKLTSEPVCASSDSRSLDCFALDEMRGLQRDYQSVGLLYVRRTSGWVHYGGSFVGSPSCIFMSGDDQFHCYMRSVDNTLVEGVLKSMERRMTVVTT